MERNAKGDIMSRGKWVKAWLCYNCRADLTWKQVSENRGCCHKCGSISSADSTFVLTSAVAKRKVVCSPRVWYKPWKKEEWTWEYQN